MLISLLSSDSGMSACESWSAYRNVAGEKKSLSMNFMAQMMDYILFLVGGEITVSWDLCVLAIGFMY